MAGSKASVLFSVAIGVMAITSAKADVLFNSLSSPNSGVLGDREEDGGFAASFNTGVRAFRLTDVSLSLGTTSFLPGDTFTVSLGGGLPLSDVVSEGGFGLSFTGEPTLASVTLPMSDLSAGLTVQSFSQFANITLQRNAMYAITLSASNLDMAPILWGTTTDYSGTGVADGYNRSYLTDNGFFPNIPAPPGYNGGPIFQMEVSGVTTPEPSTWAMMLVGLAGLGLLHSHRAHRDRLRGPVTDDGASGGAFRGRVR
jgi:hypothetical protein